MHKTTPRGQGAGAGAVLAQPPGWLRMYGDFIAKNAGQVSQIESALRSLTYIIPGRFRDAEIASETLHSSVQLLSLYHDTLLSSAAPPTRTPAPHARYTRFWAARSALYRRVALVLQVVRYTELLLEMAAKRRGGSRGRWRAVVLIEFIKAVCRLILMRTTRGRSVVSPVLPEREPPPPEDGPEDPTLGGLLPDESVKEKPAHERDWPMPRTGMDLPSLPTPGDTTGYLLSRVLTPDDVKPASRLLNLPRGAGAHAAEALHILAPLIYAVSLAASGPEGRRSWKPWMLGLAAELGARQLRERGLRTTALERDEWRRRGWGLGWWAMRGPFYDRVVKGVVEGVRGRVPGVLGGILEDYEYLWENYYFSTSD